MGTTETERGVAGLPLDLPADGCVRDVQGSVLSRWSPPPIDGGAAGPVEPVALGVVLASPPPDRCDRCGALLASESPKALI